MKVSLDWIRRYTSVEVPLAELVAKIGAQLGEVEHVSNIGEQYAGVIIAKVISCIDHPNADRLHVCVIDDGGKAAHVTRDEQGHVQVVCGAPNVREGLTVAWLPPGSTVPESVGKDPFVLEARELRGVMSNGMLASPKELALGDSHEGILELDDEYSAGMAFAEAYGLDDSLIEIENKMFTHRPDLFGELGLAREIAGITGHAFHSPDWYTLAAAVPAVEADSLPLKVENELPSLVPRFCAISLRDVTIKPSPVWLQVVLSKFGIRPINNIVDYTNYYMLLTGQPLHAYDYDKVRALSEGDEAVIVIRNPRQHETLSLLNGKTVTPRAEAIMIATNKQLIGIGGVMGGAETEVDSHTTNIILEAAQFDMYSIRRTSMEHGLFTDAVTRFSKGQSPLQNRAVLARIVDDLRKETGAKVASDIIDVNQLEDRAWVHPPVPVTTQFINERLGLELSAEAMARLLTNVEFTVTVRDDTLTVTAPFWRTDIESREDVVEEVGRLHGFDNLPLELPQRSIKPVAKDALLELKRAVRGSLVRNGAHELLTYSFVHGNLLDKAGQDSSQALQLSNALSPDLQYYRLSLTPSLLDKVHPNIKAGYKQFALFEIGKSHHAARANEHGLPEEDEVVALVVAAQRPTNPGAAFYLAKTYLEQLAISQGVSLEYVPVESFPDEQVCKPFAPQRAALVRNSTTNQLIGVIGEYSASVRRQLKLPEYAAGFEVLLTGLQGSNRNDRYTPLSRFPKIEQDISLRVDAEVRHGQLVSVLSESLRAHQPANTQVSLESLGMYAPEADATHRHHTFRIRLVNFERTMREDELSRLLDEVATAAHKACGATRL